MCGIAGILDLKQHRVDEAVLRAMCDAQAHRGPDGDGFFVDGPVGLGQRRLAIIDLAGGRQPMSNEDGSLWVTFNGEIYNFGELRPGLEAQGHRFKTHSDTEVIVHAYEQAGASCLQQFRGMFAFAAWDARRQELFLARDRLGKKPLLYTVAGGQFIFASEFQGLLQHPAVERELDWGAVDDYLTYGYIPAPRTVYRGVFKLPPAHFLRVRINGTGMVTQPERYWRLRYQPKQLLSSEAAVEGLLDILSEAVRLRLIADVPLGVLLSGGVDSSLVAALVARFAGRVKTFSIGFEEQEFNELPYARAVAEHCGTEHHELVVRTDALSVLPKLIRHYGEPYADSSAIPSYYVCQMTRHHVTVALNGDGGDECLAGYERYRAQLLAERYQRLPRLLRRWLIEPAMACVPAKASRRNRMQQVKRFVGRASLPAAERYTGWMSYFTSEQKRLLYRPEFRAQVAGHDGSAWLRSAFTTDTRVGTDVLDQVLAIDVESYLPNDLLVKMDIASMANSLEARSPLLDHKVMEYAATLPSALKIHKRVLKYLLKEAATRMVPHDAVHRRKMGFGVPVGAWMRNELRPLLNDTLLATDSRTSRYLEPTAVQRIVEEHVTAQQDHSYGLWALLCLELWHREFHV